MKYIDEFRDRKLVEAVSKKIKAINPGETIRIMEVCGTHTVSFFRFGLKELLPSNLKLISGPGCPVCVSEDRYIDQAVAYSKTNGVLVATFADMLRVPGTVSSLEKAGAEGAKLRIIYSAQDVLKLAEDNRKRKVIFLSVGFETTAPTIALTLLEAKKRKIKNLLFFSSLKLIPPAMKHLLSDGNINLQGFLCPGHVSAVIGTKAYEPIVSDYGVSCCITGFEPLDMMQAIYILMKQINAEKPKVSNQYMRLVKRNGNPKAQFVISKVFAASQVNWRGIGKIPQSALKLRREFADFDAEKVIPLSIKAKGKDARYKRCRCGDVLKGAIRPDQCALFSKECLPENPFGPCMVSSEGACNAYYKYR